MSNGGDLAQFRIVGATLEQIAPGKWTAAVKLDHDRLRLLPKDDSLGKLFPEISELRLGTYDATIEIEANNAVSALLAAATFFQHFGSAMAKAGA
jgi:hypothetical protein